MRFFVSYCSQDGESYARRAKSILEKRGHDAWVWATDRTIGTYIWEEIASEIESRDVFWCVVTPASADSHSQRREVNLSLSFGNPVWTLAKYDAEVYKELSADNYDRFSDSDYDQICERLATSDPGPLPTTRKRASALVDRRRMIRELRERTAGLDSKVLAAGLEAARTSYLETTIPREILRFSNETRSDGSYRIISIQETRRRATFNDPSYTWDHYFRQGGRLVAQGERNYLLETLVEVAPQPRQELDVSRGDYGLIDDTAKLLAESGHPAEILVAPPMPPDFFHYFERRLEWSVASDPKLRTPCGDMRIYWASRRTLPQHLIFMSRRVGVWRVVPDADTAEALTVAVGTSLLYPDLVQFVFETVAKLEVLDPLALRLIRVVGA